MTDIFISYAREDEPRIKDLVHALEEHGRSVFWERRIPTGKSWQSYIGQALGEANCVIVAWSHNSITSDWVIEEANDAKERGIVVPVLLDSVKPPLGFRGIQAADLTDWKPGYSSPHFDQLIQDIAGALGVKPPDEPAPPKPKPSETRPQEPEPIEPKLANKRPKVLIGAGITLALVIVVGSALWLARESPRVPEPPRDREPSTAIPVEPQIHRDPKVDVERLVARWLDAWLHGRAEDFVALASIKTYILC